MGEGRSEVERRKQLEPASCSPSSRESSRSPSWARLAAGVFALAVVAGVFAVGLAARAAAASSSKRRGAARRREQQQRRGAARPVGASSSNGSLAIVVDDAGDAGHHHPGHCSNLRFAVPTSCSTKCL